MSEAERSELREAYYRQRRMKGLAKMTPEAWDRLREMYDQMTKAEELVEQAQAVLRKVKYRERFLPEELLLSLKLRTPEAKLWMGFRSDDLRELLAAEGKDPEQGPD